MSNKKGGIAIEELVPLLTVMFVVVVALLFFYGCSISKAKNQYEQFEFQKDEIEVTKALNFFLEIPVDENMKVSDVIVQAYLNNDINYDQLNDLADNYFSQKSHARWGISLDHGSTWLHGHFINYEIVPENDIFKYDVTDENEIIPNFFGSELCLPSEAPVVFMYGNRLDSISVKLYMNPDICN